MKAVAPLRTALLATLVITLAALACEPWSGASSPVECQRPTASGEQPAAASPSGRRHGAASRAQGEWDAHGSPSVQITGIKFDPSSHHRFENETDIYPITWAAGGRLFTMGGDGDGWDGSDTRGLDVSRLAEVGPDGDLGQGTECSRKTDVLPKGIISIDGVLYRWEEERADADADGGRFEDTMIGRSTDHGVTWEYLTGGDPARESDYAYTGVFHSVSFVQMGKDYQVWWDESYGGEGAYVYFVSDEGDDVILGRAPRSSDLRNPDNHEWFTGTDAQNDARWSGNVADRRPIYTEPEGDLHWSPTVTWNPILNRFLLAHFDAGDNGILTILEGPTPWGPWTRIHDDPLPGSLGDGVEKYRLQFVNKRGTSGVTDWLSSDGKIWWAVFSGPEDWDSFNTIRADLIAAD